MCIRDRFKHWNNERPYGTVTQNLGNISILNHYYEYALYCKSLNISIQKFNKEVKEKLQHQNNQLLIETIATQHNMEIRNKSDYYIFTLDSSQSNDYDDAISYDKKEHKISIYITNVALIMDHLDLWGAFSNRISTIYLPDRKRVMLPTKLSDNICSLLENNIRMAFTLDLLIEGDKISFWITSTDKSGNEIIGLGGPDSPRNPSIRIIEFLGSYSREVVEPGKDLALGDSVRIVTYWENPGKLAGSFQVGLYEQLSDGSWRPSSTTLENGDSVIYLPPGSSSVKLQFEYQTWIIGQPILVLVINEDFENSNLSNIEIPELLDGISSVSYTHLTLPTKRIV